MKTLIFALLLITCTAFASPTPLDNVVFKPTFLSGYDSLTAGTGFVARIGDTHVFLTAHHLFGPAAGLERNLTPAEAKEFAIALAASSMTHASLILVSSEMILIPTARAFDRRDTSHDVAAFRLASYSGPALRISATPPKVGEKVYMLARPRGEEKLRLISAVVSQVRETVIEYFYDETGVNFAGTSGAPVLNEIGEVVAMNLGGGDVRGKAMGIGNPAAAFSALLASAK